MDHFDKNKDFFNASTTDKNGRKKSAVAIVLTQDELIHIMTHIIISSNVPDLAS